MRRFGLLDLLVILIVVVLLALAARQEFGNYDGRTIAPASSPAPPARGGKSP